MLRFLPLIALATVLPAAAQTRPPATTGDGTPDKPIIITGERLEDLQRDLAACIARKCPPLEDIAASLKVAENQFVNGDYKGSRQTLTKAEGRNRKYARDYPVAVAGLFRADSRVSAHLGEGELYRINAFETVSALKAGLADDDPRVLGSQIEIGDMYARFGRVEAALQQYASIAQRAHKLGLTTVEGMARLRIVGLFAQLSESDPGVYRKEATDAARDLIAEPNPKLKPFGQAARVVVARMSARNGDSAAIDTLIADLRTSGGTNVPVLVYAPIINPESVFVDRLAPITTPGTKLQLSESPALLAADDYKGAWVDIGFWVTADGRVADITILRSGKASDPEPAWTKAVIKAISGRRYAKLDLDPNEPGVFRVERYTLTARYNSYQTGTNLRVRDRNPQIEMLDLSVDPAAKSKPAK